jgi:hypothetical protein
VAEHGPSLRERTTALQSVLHKQSAQVRRLIRERDALEDYDVRRALGAGVGALKPSTRLAAVNAELEQAVAARGTTSNELDSLFSSGSSGSEDDFSAMSSNSVRLLLAVFISTC